MKLLNLLYFYISDIWVFDLGSNTDEKNDGVKDAGTDISSGVSRRDMATQMSPEGSSHSSPERRLSFSNSNPSALPIMELQSVPSSKLEVRDVQVDERVTMTRWSKKHKARFPGKGSDNVDNWKKKDLDAQSSDWDIKTISKYEYLTTLLLTLSLFCGIIE